jgi:TetR/AcrR family transcriptional regulator, mexJK operon transcriptional repressor
MTTISVAARPGAGKPHGGRPTLAEARRRHEHLLGIAGEMFMRLGFDGTSIDAVAEAAGVSKRTLYAHYADKSELFGAVLRGLIERCLVPITRFQSSTDALEPTLIEIGRHLLTSVLAPAAVSVHRIVIAESERQPAFGRLAHAEGRKLAVEAIAGVLRRHRARLRVRNLHLAAAQFLSLVVDNSLCLATLGIEDGNGDIDAQVRAAVDLFLSGAAQPTACAPREPARRSCSRPRK